jgi:hypothetical protein
MTLFSDIVNHPHFRRYTQLKSSRLHAMISGFCFRTRNCFSRNIWQNIKPHMRYLLDWIVIRRGFSQAETSRPTIHLKNSPIHRFTALQTSQPGDRKSGTIRSIESIQCHSLRGNKTIRNARRAHRSCEARKATVTKLFTARPFRLFEWLELHSTRLNVHHMKGVG